MRKQSLIYKYTTEELLNIANKCKSVIEYAELLGYNSISGAVYTTIKTCLTKRGLANVYDELSASGRTLPNRKNTTALPDGLIFTKDSKVHRCTAKYRILRDNLLPYKCAICGNEGVWNGKKLVLRLDHINGVNNDNRLSNLRFVCPNCDSQLNTFAGRNVKKVKKIRKKPTCPKCGKPMDKDARVCWNCYINERKQKSKCPTKEQLIQDIKIMSMVKIGEKYGVSDKAVKKWCIKLKLPHTRGDIKKLRQADIV